MERYVVREPRSYLKEYSAVPQRNQPTNYSQTHGSKSMIHQESMLAGSYSSELPMHSNAGYFEGPHVVTLAQYASPNTLVSPGQVMSGIDSRYLSAYSDNTQGLVMCQQRPIQRENIFPHSNLNLDHYQSRNVVGADRNRNLPLVPHAILPLEEQQSRYVESDAMRAPTHSMLSNDVHQYRSLIGAQHAAPLVTAPKKPKLDTSTSSLKVSEMNQSIANVAVSTPQQSFPEVKPIRSQLETPNPSKTRFDKLKALHKSGPRAFSGPVEKVLKWHKAMQDVGLLILYEIVAKCVSVRDGESCAKNLVIRDENGPAMQVVYYEIDFLLPELNPPCTIRVVGRMMAGSSRLQALSVRAARGADLATAPRRAAAASHHLATLAREYTGINTQ